MNSRLILVEGIPGAGKTTTARKIKEKLIDEGKEAILYEEGMSHPADMAWNACLKEDEYNDFIKKVDETGLDIDKILLEMIKEWIE